VEALAGLWPAGAAPQAYPGMGSGGGLKALGAGALDLAVSGRPLAPHELAQGLQQHPWLQTPLVVASAAAAPLLPMGRQALAQVLSGRMATWPDGSPLRPVLRPESDGDSALLRQLGPEVAAALAAGLQRPGVRIAMSDQDAAQDLQRIAGALGITSLALVRLAGGALRAWPLDGLAPGAPGYPLNKTLYLVTPPRPAAGVQAALGLLRSPAAHERLLPLGCDPEPRG
jgi:phosphate transport system substrate-binding protein